MTRRALRGRPRSRERERGRGFLVVTALLAIAATGAATVHARTTEVAAEARRAAACERARWAAEGGVEHARAALRADPAWTGGAVVLDDAPAQRLRVEVEAGPVEGDPALRRVRAIGFAAGIDGRGAVARRSIAAIVRLGPAALPVVESWHEADGP